MYRSRKGILKCHLSGTTSNTLSSLLVFSLKWLLRCSPFLCFPFLAFCYPDAEYYDLVLSLSYFPLRSSTCLFVSLYMSFPFSSNSSIDFFFFHFYHGPNFCELFVLWITKKKEFLFYGCDISSLSENINFFSWKFSSPSVMFHSICSFFHCFTWCSS